MPRAEAMFGFSPVSALDIDPNDRKWSPSLRAVRTISRSQVDAVFVRISFWLLSHTGCCVCAYLNA
jgi:hypothetical protein